MTLVELANGDVQPVKSAFLINAAGAWAGEVSVSHSQPVGWCWFFLFWQVVLDECLLLSKLSVGWALCLGTEATLKSSKQRTFCVIRETNIFICQKYVWNLAVMKCIKIMGN